MPGVRDITGFAWTGGGTASRAGLAHPPARAGFRIAVSFLALIAGTGCYVYPPVSGPVAPRTALVLTLNDRGRVGLGDSIGPSAAVIEGRLQSESDTTYDMRVSSVGYLNRQFNQWNGEPLTVRKEFVGSVRERRLSRGRTILAGGGIAAGIAAFIASRGFGIFGSPEPDPSNGGGDPEDQ